MNDGPVVGFGYWWPIFQVQHPNRSTATWAVVGLGYSSKRTVNNLAKAGGAGTTRALWCHAQPASSCWQQLIPQSCCYHLPFSSSWSTSLLQLSPSELQTRMGKKTQNRLQHSLMSTGLKFISMRIIHSRFWDYHCLSFVQCPAWPEIIPN